jgi:hypothetical protein
MDTFKIGLVILAAAAAACAGAVVLKVPEGEAFYYGQVSFFSPNGKLPYGETESVVKREILENGARIVETVTQPGRAPGMRPAAIVTVLKRRGKTLAYYATDSGATFTGRLTFKDAGLKAWTYDIKLKDGGTITGAGELTPAGIKTAKQLGGVARPMLIKEDLGTIKAAEYMRRVAEMAPPRWAE